MLHGILVCAEAITMQTLLGMTLKGLICRDNFKLQLLLHALRKELNVTWTLFLNGKIYTFM